MSDWFTSLANQAIQFADSLTDSLEQISNSAQEELRSEQNKLVEEELLKNQQLNKNNTQLPWETNVESLQILSDELMESILKLSLNEKNFICTPVNSNDINFKFSDFIATALHLLKVDANLAHIHSRISPKMDEETFWCNYYCRVIFLRAKSGIDGNDAKNNSLQYDENEIIFCPNTSNSLFKHESNSIQPVNQTVLNTRNQTILNNTKAPTEKVSDYNEMKSDKLNEDDDIDLADLDDLDIEGLDADDDDAFEKIHKEQYDSNDELEAQIALELAQG